MQNLPFLDDDGGRTTDDLLALEGQYRIDSLVSAFEMALMEKTQPTEPERVVLAVEAIEREVNNGGFSQFFANSSAEHAYFAPIALRAIGAPRTAELVERAVYLVAGDEVLDADALQAKMADSDELLDKQLHELDKVYYEGEEEPLADKLFEYIKRNRASIAANAP